VATSTTPSAVAADAGGVTKMKSTKEKNTSIARRYRSQRCPRWRIRHEAAAPKTHKALLYVDGSHPFEKATETRDGITVWTRMAPGVAVKEVLAEITFPHTHRDKLWRAVNDVDRYKEFVPFVKKCEVGVGAGAGKGYTLPLLARNLPTVGRQRVAHLSDPGRWLSSECIPRSCSPTQFIKATAALKPITLRNERALSFFQQTTKTICLF
jgi:hypothetical protein